MEPCDHQTRPALASRRNRPASTRRDCRACFACVETAKSHSEDDDPTEERDPTVLPGARLGRGHSRDHCPRMNC